MSLDTQSSQAYRQKSSLIAALIYKRIADHIMDKYGILVPVFSVHASSITYLPAVIAYILGTLRHPNHISRVLIYHMSMLSNAGLNRFHHYTHMS